MKRSRWFVAPLLFAISMSSFGIGAAAIAQTISPISPIGIIIITVTSCTGGNFIPGNTCGGACYLGGTCLGQLGVGPAGNILTVCTCLGNAPADPLPF